MLQTVFLVAQIVVSILLVGMIMLQSEGSGLSASWSGGGETYHTKRGVEKVLFIATIAGVVIFTFLAVGNVVI